MQEYTTIIRTTNKLVSEMVENFAQFVCLALDDDLIVSDNIAKEYWIDEFKYRFEEDVEKAAKEQQISVRELEEVEYENFINSGGWDNTNGFDEWTNDYEPKMLW